MRKHTLIVYYSLSGTTAGLAKSLAAALGSDQVDVEQISEPRPLRGAAGAARAAIRAALRRASPIVTPLRRPAEYDTVLIGAPIWMGRVATPLRGYLRTQAWGQARLGLFTTSAGPVGPAAVREVERLVGRSLDGRLHLINRQAPALDLIEGFLQPLGLSLARPPLTLPANAPVARATAQAVP